MLGLVCSPCLLHPRWARLVPDVWIAVTLWLLKSVCNIRIDIKGARPFIPCIVAAKHQSALDTLLLWRLLGGPVFILKQELCQIPIFGWYLMRMRPIAIRRHERSLALREIEQQARTRIAQGRMIVIFPEGTRTKPGASSRYKMAGITLLYTSLALPVVPVALNTGCVWGRNAFIKYPGCVTIEFLPAIEAGQPAEMMATQLQQQIESASKALLPMGGGA